MGKRQKNLYYKYNVEEVSEAGANDRQKCGRGRNSLRNEIIKEENEKGSK